jgi:hypothetical protein
MTTRLEAPLKREILIKGEPYRLTVSPLGLHLARKGRRKGCELSWLDFVNGEAALATALNASLQEAPGEAPVAPRRKVRVPHKRLEPVNAGSDAEKEEVMRDRG